MKKTNEGFSKTELIISLALIVILFAIGSKILLDNTGKNFKRFKTLANSFASSVSLYKDKYPNDSNVYYLKDVINKGFSSSLRNPLEPTEYCDEYNSYVQVPSSGAKIVHLYCGDYYVQGIQNQKYSVYELSEWTEDESKKYNETDTLYNYKKGGKLVLSNYETSAEILRAFYENEGKKLNNPFLINSLEGYSLETKTVYRNKNLVKEIK